MEIWERCWTRPIERYASPKLDWTYILGKSKDTLERASPININGQARSMKKRRKRRSEEIRYLQ
jgi:hypothetical protein